MISEYEQLIPHKILFTIKDINDMGLIKTSMLRKLIYNNKLEVVKIGNKNHISRNELIAYLQRNTLPSVA